MNVLVAGDSWGEGVRDSGHQLHPGIGAFFQDFGWHHHNVSLGGYSNSEILGSIREFYRNNHAPTVLVIFWTCPLREWKQTLPSIKNINSWCQLYWSDVFNDLLTIVGGSTKLISIGGLADVDVDPSPGINYTISSCCDLLMPDHHHYPFGDFKYVDRAFDDVETRYQVLDNIDKKMKNFKKYIGSTMRRDGGHPSADGYRRIFESIPREIYD